MSTISRPRIHFTEDHEWIDFNGTVGFIGLSAFKLAEIKKIDSIKWFNNKGVISKGTLIANLHCGDEIIPVNAPVKGKFLGPNIKLTNNLDLILESPQDRGWIFFITPSKFQDKDGLLQPEDYQKFIRVPAAV